MYCKDSTACSDTKCSNACIAAAGATSGSWSRQCSPAAFVPAAPQTQALLLLLNQKPDNTIWTIRKQAGNAHNIPGAAAPPQC